MKKMKIEERLKKKGWKKREINKAKKVLAKGELKRSKFLHHFSFLTALLVFLTGNLFGSIVLIPVFLLTKSLYLILFLLLFGLSFGVLFELIIAYFEDEKHHTIIAGLTVFLIVFLNIYYITLLSNFISSSIFNTEGNHHPLSASLTYLVVFSLPFLFHKFIKSFK